MPQKRTYTALITLLLGSLLLWVSCRKPPVQDSGNQADPNEDATRGNIRIGIDNTVREAMEEELESFLRTYPEAHITPVYASEDSLSRLLIADSVRCIIVGRDFTGAERQAIRARNITPRTYPLFRDGVALITHPENPVKRLSRKELESIFHGDIRNWRDLNPAAPDGPIQVVFDEPGSGLLRQIQEMFTEKDSLRFTAYAAGHTDTLFQYVNRSPLALGLAGFNAISDKEDPVVIARLSKISLLRLEATDSTEAPGTYVHPWQTEISTGQYPLLRTINALSREHFMGLGTGFVTYIAGDIGQRILLKDGLVPCQMPPRVVIMPE